MAGPDTPIDRLEYITQPERELLLRGFNSNVLAPSELMHPEQTMHGMLEHWAAIQPDVPALIFEARPLHMKALCIRDPLARILFA